MKIRLTILVDKLIIWLLSKFFCGVFDMKIIKVILGICLLITLGGCGSKYEIVEITKDNFFDYFELSYVLDVNYNAFGEPVDAHAFDSYTWYKSIFVVRDEYEIDYSKSELAIEYSFQYDYYDYDIDYENSKAILIEKLNDKTYEDLTFDNQLKSIPVFSEDDLSVKTEIRKLTKEHIHNKQISDKEITVIGIPLAAGYGGSGSSQMIGVSQYLMLPNPDTISLNRVEGSISIKKK